MIKFTRDLHYGNIGLDVRNLQIALTKLDYANLTGTGFFGEKTMQAVSAFQIANNITPTKGYFGTKTRAILLDKLSNMNRERLYITAVSCLGTDVTPDDIVPDEYDCADTVNQVFYKTFNEFIGGGASTYSMYRSLGDVSRFDRVDIPKCGDIIISPTGYGNGNLSNGHVGIVGQSGVIMSNNSYIGLFEENYTLDSWKARYGDKGGYPIAYFRVK